jgi:uracil-DNA glycosylase family 4
MPRDAGCTKCPLHVGAKNPCVWGEGPKHAKVMVIGEYPNRKEDERERPFLGEPGQLIRAELGRAGIDDVYFTYAVKCRPPDFGTPNASQIKICKSYLDEEIAGVKPEFVITLGALASKAVLKKSKITQAHGQLIEMPSYTGMPVFSPAYALRDISKLPAIKNDLARLKREIDGTQTEQTVTWSKLTRKNFFQFLTEFDEADAFSFDVETSSLNWFDPNQKIRCLGIGLPKRSWVIPLDMPNSVYYGRPLAQRRLIRLIVALAEGKTAVGQNAKFDNHWLFAKYGVRFFLDFDVMLAHHLIDENQAHDLEYMARIELDVPEYDIPLKEKKGAHLHLADGRRRFFEYNAKDTAYTLRLYYKFRKRLHVGAESNLARLFYRLVMPAARALQEIEEEGLTLRQELYAEILAKTIVQRDEELEKLQKMAEEYGNRINWNSPKQVAALLYDRVGITCKIFTKTKAPSTGEEALLELKGTHAVADQLIRFRELEKFLGTYLIGWQEFTVDGKLYLSYKLHGTVTGRYSSRLHQVPRDGTIRNLVDAPPGWEFAQADLSQAELRIAAEFSGDVELVNCFRPGGADVHWRTMLHTVGTGASGEYYDLAVRTAAKLAGESGKPSLSTALEILLKAGHEAAIAINKDWKEARKRGKSINFGFIFGMYENKFIQTCKLKYGYEPTFKEAQAFRQAYFELFRGIVKWHDKQKKLVGLDGYVKNLFGRVRRLPGIFSSDKGLRMEAERQAINSPVQGTIGDWKAAALVEIHETVPRDKLRIVAEVHDALLMIVRKGCRDEVLPRVREILREPTLLKSFKIKMSVPMDSEIEIGPWGAGTKYEDPIHV